jgi:type I restriction enzyme S subunit
MSGVIKYIPLTFVSSSSEKERLIRNTVLLRHFASKADGNVTLSHYIESTQYGFNASAKDSGTHRFVRISDISNGEIAWDTVPFCECDDPETYLLKKHDIVVARTGGTTGKSYMVSTPPKGSIYAGYLIRVRANSETNPSFLSAFLNSYFYWSQITSLNRDEFRPSVNAEKLKELRLPKFDRAVQDQIVRLSNYPTDGADSSIRAELNAVLAKRNAHESIVAEIENQQSLLAKLKQAILQEAIQGKLTADWRAAHPDVEPASQLLHRIQAEKARLIAAKKLRPEKPLPNITPAEIPFEIPKGWEWCRATHPAYLIPDRDKKVPTSQILSAGKFPVVDQGKVLIRGFTDNAECLIELDGPIVLFGDHTREAKYIDFDFVVGADGVKLLRPILVSPKYYHLAISTVRIEAKNYARHFKFLKESFIPLPPLAEQAAIVERVEALMTTYRLLEAEIEHARTHAAHLIQAVLKEAFAPAAKVTA